MPTKYKPSSRATTKKRPTVLDLFCGAGGFSLGFEQAGFDISLGVDRDGYHVATHERNFPRGKTICASVTDLSADSILSEVPDQSSFDVIIGGPPCQGFSNMGNRDEADPRNDLVAHFARLVCELRPTAFVMENVPGLLSGKMRPFLKSFIDRMESNGFVVVRPVQILNALDFGVPQNRKRVFVIGIRADVDRVIDYPGPSVKEPSERTTVWEALADLPTIERSSQLFESDLIRYDKQPRSTYAKLARNALDDEDDLSNRRIWNQSVCSGCGRTAHTERTKDLYRSTEPGGVVPGHKLPRLSKEGFSPTLRAGSDSSRGSYTSPRPVHPIKPRCITVREAARLHGYPDWFRFYPTKWHGYKQIGNSVCPPVSKAIGRELRTIFDSTAPGYAPEAIKLSETFQLPSNRPRQSKRIPQVREFPKVIERIFFSGFDCQHRRLWKSRFTFDDVLSAIESTGANLKWVRRDTFVRELARSRNVKKLLETPLSFGYSLKAVDDDEFIAEFVSKDSDAAITTKKVPMLRTSDLVGDESISIDRKKIECWADEPEQTLSSAPIRSKLWSESVISIERDGKLLFELETPTSGLHIQYRGRKKRAILFRGNGSFPDLVRIRQVGLMHDCNEVVVAIEPTSDHIVISRFLKSKTSPKEVRRCTVKRLANIEA